MKKMLIFLPLIFLANFTFASWKVVVTVSEADAEIFVNGLKIGTPPQTIKIGNKECVDVEIKKRGFITEKRKYCIGLDKQGIPEAPKKDYIVLKKDEFNDAFVTTDKANIDFPVEVNKKYSEDAAWKLVNQIVTNYIDDIVQNNKESGYLMTAWKIQTFAGKTIRTRIIVKLSNSSPLTYKIKIESQYCDEENVSAKADEKFKELDKILKKYENLISEFQTRLGEK